MTVISSSGHRAPVAFVVSSMALALAAGCPFQAAACFGVNLRVGFSRDPGQALASYAAGYYVEEKTGVRPDFVEVTGDPEAALAKGEIDLFLAQTALTPPEAVSLRDAGEVPGFGPSRFWIRPEVLDDLRFFTVDRALRALPGFYVSGPYQEASARTGSAKKTARGAVLRAP